MPVRADDFIDCLLDGGFVDSIEDLAEISERGAIERGHRQPPTLRRADLARPPRSRDGAAALRRNARRRPWRRSPSARRRAEWVR
jgi:hypothetical protein